MAHPKGPNRPAKSTPTVMNPIRGWTLSREDMGVDAYAPAGKPFYAPADSTSITSPWPVSGWPGNGAYYFKFDPPLKGTPSGTQYWYIAEGINMRVGPGQKVQVGDIIGTSSGTSIETGWGSTTGNGDTLAVQQGDGTTAAHNPSGNPTTYGQTFKSFFGINGALGQISTQGKPGGGQPGSPGTATPGSPSTTNANTAQAFVAELNFPSIEDEVTAIALGAEHKGLMHDQQLLPFVQQLAQGSMRSFQSLPDGSFYAFYPDYFGEFGHHNAYWLIDDIEILTGGINLTDDALATHVFAVGDNTWPVNQELLNMLFSAGTINVFNAFLEPGIIPNPSSQTGGQPNPSTTKGTKETGMQSVMTQEEAVQFIQRYGARPLVNNYPMVRSNVFEMLLAYQQFMYSWATQFITPYTFTFMPELYPGGKVGFPSHGLKMYVNSVTHSFDYEEGGFTTEAELVAPSLLYPDANPTDFDLPSNMVQAMVEPIRNTVSATQKTVGNAETNIARTIERYVTHVDVGSEPGIDRLPAGSPP